MSNELVSKISCNDKFWEAMLIQRLRYSLAEAAEALGISRSMIDVVIREKGLVVHSDTPGGHRYISHSSLENYIREQEEKPVFGRRIQVQKR